MSSRFRRSTGPRADVNPIAVGVALAGLAAVLFGITTPIIQKAGADAGPFYTSMLLYAGAAIGTSPWWKGTRRRGAPLGRRHAGRLMVIALIGSAIAPACFVWGLQRTSAASASLLLSFEAVFTVLLGWSVHGEWISGRVVVSVVLMALGGAVLVASGGASATVGLGAIAVVLATFAWALDNTLIRPLAELDPVQVVRWKGALGALLCFAGSRALREPVPGKEHMAVLLICGATGYGIGLRFYLLAQRRIGAARTGSVFALSPFIGAAAAWAMGEHANTLPTLVAASLFGLAVYLHASESHSHRHTHEPVEHDHAHTHDDGHHDHRHDPEVVGQHSHVHAHEERTHQHAHGSDVHHGHRHT